MQTIIEVENLGFSYNEDRIFDNLSIKIDKGDFVGILGPNGSGKTTLVKILLNILKPDSGSVKLFGKSLEDEKIWDKIGYVPQKYALDKNFPATVQELFDSVSNKDSQSQMMKILGTKNFLDKKFTELSGGQQQRVMTVLAFLKKPKLLVLDEPTVGVDVKTNENFFNFLHDLNKKFKTTILVVSHDLAMISKYARTIVCVNKSMCCMGPVQNMPDYLKEVYGGDFKVIGHTH